MKNSWKYIVIPILLFACQSDVKPSKTMVQDPKYILSSYSNFWPYWYNEVKLSEDFIPYNEHDSIITKESFLKQVCTGNYLPVKYVQKDSLNSYKLYTIENNKDSSIASTIVMFGKLAYQFFQMEGKPLPDFNFVDLNGNVYNPQTCKGKVVVLNFWFIGCTACRQEMPALNKMVASYKDRKDVLFVSLAPDDPDSLKKFLEKNPFAYEVIPRKNKYVIDTLNIRMFPTQMIIDRKGLVAKVPEDYKQMEIELRNELVKK